MLNKDYQKRQDEVLMNAIAEAIDLMNVFLQILEDIPAEQIELNNEAIVNSISKCDKIEIINNNAFGGYPPKA